VRIEESLQKSVAFLKPSSESPVLDAEILLSEVLQKPKSFLLAHPEYLLSTGEKKKYGIFLQKRLQGFSIAVILGYWEFYGRPFFVDGNVLIPRPETELLAQELIPFLKTGGTLVDVGIGSGCIALTLGFESSPDRLIGLDTSPNALSLAQKNAHFHQITLETYESDLLSALPKDIDTPLVLAANLPYVPESERHISVKKEPQGAIYSGVDGLDHFRRFFSQLSHISFRACVFEFHPPQKDFFTSFCKELFPTASLRFFRDLSGHWRGGVLSYNQNNF